MLIPTDQESPAASAPQTNQKAAEGLSLNVRNLYQQLIKISEEADEREIMEMEALRSENDRLRAKNQKLRAFVDQLVGQKEGGEDLLQAGKKGKGKGEEVATSDDDKEDDAGFLAWDAYYHGSGSGSSTCLRGLGHSDDELNNETVSFLLARTEQLVADNGQVREELEKLRHEQQSAKYQDQTLKTRVEELEAFKEEAEKICLDNQIAKNEMSRLKKEKEKAEQKLEEATNYHDYELSVLRKRDNYFRGRLESCQGTMDGQFKQIQALQYALSQLRLQNKQLREFVANEERPLVYPFCD